MSQMTPLMKIDEMAKELAAARALLSERLTGLDDEVRQARNRRLPGIRAALARAKAAQADLRSLVDANRGEFGKPRTRVLHGIKVGLQKAKGVVKFLDAAKVVELIKKHFEEQADVLIKTKETPVKAALQQLTAADLKKLGVTVEDTGDEIVIAPVDSDLDKLIDALLDEGKDAAEDES